MNKLLLLSALLSIILLSATKVYSQNPGNTVYTEYMDFDDEAYDIDCIEYNTVVDQATLLQTSDVTPPKFKGGEAAMFRFLDSVLIVPQEVADNKISGRVIVRFLVDKDGSIQSPSIQRSLSPDCDKAALEAVSMMPAWLPARQNGSNITGFAFVPVSFNTQKIYYKYAPSKAELLYKQHELINKRWKLIEINNRPIPTNLAEQPYFVMSIDNRNKRVVEGNASCAKFRARYHWNMRHWRLTFSKIEATVKKCEDPEIIVIDNTVFTLLKKTREYRITEDGQLKIGRVHKGVFVPLATFEPEALKETVVVVSGKE